LLSFYFPNKSFSDEEIDKETMQEGGWSWLPPAVVWLNKLGLKAKVYSRFDYKRLYKEGEEFMKEFKGETVYLHEKANGTYKNLSLIQGSCKEMVKLGLYKERMMSKDELAVELNDKNTLAIGKTVYEWLAGRYIMGNSHFIVVIKEYTPGVWRINDPGLPEIKDRKVQQTINNHDILGDILLVRGIK
jgi:hypothetical protein